MGTLNNITLKNQFGETSINQIVDSDGVPLPPQATLTVVANLTGGSATPTAVTTQALANKLPAKAGVQSISAEGAAGAVTIALSTSNTYSDAAVNTAVNTALASVVTELNAAITAVNAILAALKVVS